MVEKFYEHDLNLHFLFIDYKQAVDSINREELFKVLREVGITPVSYTHLDVYKRQVQTLSNIY